MIDSTSVADAAQVDERPVVVSIQHASKIFRLKHTHSIKEFIVWNLRGRGKELHGTFKALDDISLTIRQGESVALLGLNGSGKSTTLKLISGVITPDTGTVGIRGRIAGLIEVGAGFHPDLSGRENVYLNGAILGMSEQQINERFDEIVAFSEKGEFIDQEVKFYSSGMFLRLAFSVAAHSEPDIFLIDEILAVGDEPFQRKCLDRVRELRERGQTLVIVTHDLDKIKEVADRGIVLRSGRVAFDGPIDEAVTFIRHEG